MLTIAAIVITLAAGTSSPQGAVAANLQQTPPPGPAAAASNESHDIRQRVEVGQKVTITDDGGRQFEGRIEALGPDRLSLAARGRMTELAYEDIVRIDRPHDGLGNGARIGFGVGALFGIALVLQEESADCDSSAFFACSDPSPAAYVVAPAVFGGLGAAIGVCVDALIRREPNIYRRGGTTSVRVAPRFGRRGGGVVLSVRW